MPRVAPGDALDRQPRATQRSQPFDRLERVRRAGRMEAARAAEQRVYICAAESLFAGVAPSAAQTTPRRARPFARRARITARPPRVRIRTRNPCVRFRRSTEGWKVRFMKRFPQSRQNFVLDDF